MRGLLRGILFGSLLVFPISLVGCGGTPENEVMDFDETESEKQAEQYQKEMEEAMMNQGQPVPEQ